MKHKPIPDDYEVKPLGPDDTAKDRATCGHCGLSWDDGIATSMTPAPSARCPFEAFHIHDDEWAHEKNMRFGERYGSGTRKLSPDDRRSRATRMNYVALAQCLDAKDGPLAAGIDDGYEQGFELACLHRADGKRVGMYYDDPDKQWSYDVGTYIGACLAAREKGLPRPDTGGEPFPDDGEEKGPIMHEVFARWEDARQVINAVPCNNGRSDFRWVTFANGDVALIVYPKGELFERLLQKGAFT